MAQAKKISVATIYGKINLKELMAAGKLPVMIVMGTAIVVKSGESQFGDWRSLLGTFRAIHPTTGEITEAPQVFLPDVALIPIEVSLSASRGVQFAIRVLAQYVADNPGRKAGGAPYEYIWEPLIEAAEDNPLDTLMRRVDAKLLPDSVQKLLAPKAAPKALKSA
jgi:hypothetical protein